MTTTDLDLLASLIAQAPPRPPHVVIRAPADPDPLPATLDAHDYIPPTPEHLDGAPAAIVDALTDQALAHAEAWLADPCWDLTGTVEDEAEAAAGRLAEASAGGGTSPDVEAALAAIVDGARALEAASWARGREITDRERRAEIALDLAWRKEWAAAAYAAAKELHDEIRNARRGPTLPAIDSLEARA